METNSMSPEQRAQVLCQALYRALRTLALSETVTAPVVTAIIFL